MLFCVDTFFGLGICTTDNGNLFVYNLNDG